MKQHIDLFQLLELTPEQHEKLREWWNPLGWDYIAIRHKNSGIFPCFTKLPTLEESGERFKPLTGIVNACHQDNEQLRITLISGNDIVCSKNDCLPLLSIGQCIELLTDLGKTSEHIAYDYMDDCRDGLIQYIDSCSPLFGIYWHGIGSGTELIDALWQGIKEAL